MTSAVTSSFSRSYSDQQEDSADEKRCARYGMSCDGISLDIITISSWISADEAKRKRRCDVVLENQQMKRDAKEKRRRRGGNSAVDIQQEDFALLFQQSKLQWIQSQRKDIQTQSIVVEEDSGEAFDEPDASNSSIQSKRLFESAVALYNVQSQEFQAQRIEEVAKRSSRSDKSAAKQLTTYEELSKMNVNC
ncbi:low-temperature-induced cysteine protein-like [Dorcoceras hygrometricum]|uniref:Low-temperature-induced cysteine protein-like n=1 Tax=Dorcoceras hygrometricum TaxID=472368 RepID=A0A2Z7AZV7_9LAMI|nr:low-temperature-induced cysteine protein-like [Dorcoceras hygrometricum]